MELSILLPCFNEEKTIATCIKKASLACQKAEISHEIIVIDNNSTDRSVIKAKSAGAKVIKQEKQGYGAAYIKGIQSAKGDYLFMADADDTYDLNDIPQFYKETKRGFSVVIGNRFSKKLGKGVMPWLHKHIGNPLISGLINILFSSPVKDTQCGMRLIKTSLCRDLQLQSKGMEFASEMIIKLAKRKIPIKQLPITYAKRKSPSKLRSFSDGWQHFRFIFMMSPTITYLIPGLLLTVFSSLFIVLVFFGVLKLGSVIFNTHSLFVASILLIIGIQFLLTGYFSRVFAVTYLREDDRFIKRIQKSLTLEKGLFAGGLLFMITVIWGLSILISWIAQGFPEIDQVKLGIILFTFMIISLQIIASTFHFYTIKTINEEQW
ncbi:MAG: glycosyltransferase [Nanoarchaeota archaeon]|nr:glycosyltransferase [Nanoarchaeota archaeon]